MHASRLHCIAAQAPCILLVIRENLLPRRDRVSAASRSRSTARGAPKMPAATAACICCTLSWPPPKPLALVLNPIIGNSVGLRAWLRFGLRGLSPKGRPCAPCAPGKTGPPCCEAFCAPAACTQPGTTRIWYPARQWALLGQRRRCHADCPATSCKGCESSSPACAHACRRIVDTSSQRWWMRTCTSKQTIARCGPRLSTGRRATQQVSYNNYCPEQSAQCVNVGFCFERDRKSLQF